jgi:hypothetical protein
MAIFTSSQFQAVAQSGIDTKSFTAAVKEVRNQSKQASTISVFLSHGHADKVLVEQAVFFLIVLISRCMFIRTVETMTKNAGETGQNIKNKITTNNKFIFLASNAGSSQSGATGK